MFKYYHLLKSSFISIFAVLFVLLLSAGSAAIVEKLTVRRQLPSERTVSGRFPPKNLPTISSGELALWKTYISKKIGITFHYPPEVNIVERMIGIQPELLFSMGQFEENDYGLDNRFMSISEAGCDVFKGNSPFEENEVHWQIISDKRVVESFGIDDNPPPQAGAELIGTVMLPNSCVTFGADRLSYVGIGMDWYLARQIISTISFTQ